MTVPCKAWGGRCPCIKPCGTARASLSITNTASTLSISLTQIWCRELFLDYARDCATPYNRSTLLRNLASLERRKGFFDLLDTWFRDAADITHDSLLRKLGVEGLRRQRHVVEFLIRRLGLVRVSESVLAWSALWDRVRHIEQTLPDARAAIFSDYFGTLLGNTDAEGRRLSLNSLRVYCNAAKRLLEFGCTPYTTPDWPPAPATITRFLARHPGQRACLSPFVAYLGLKMPGQQKKSARSSLRTVLQKLVRTAIEGNQVESRYSTMVALSVTCDQPIQRVSQALRLQADEPFETVSFSTNQPMQLIRPLSEALQRIHREAEYSEWLIPGVMNKGPTHAKSSVRFLHQVHGVQLRTLRTAVRIATDSAAEPNLDRFSPAQIVGR